MRRAAPRAALAPRWRRPGPRRFHRSPPALPTAATSRAPTLLSRAPRRYGKTTSKRNTPQKHHSASRKVIRHILNQLEALGIVEKIDKAGGRGITAEGRKDLDTISNSAELEM